MLSTRKTGEEDITRFLVTFSLRYGLDKCVMTLCILAPVKEQVRVLGQHFIGSGNEGQGRQPQEGISQFRLKLE